MPTAATHVPEQDAGKIAEELLREGKERHMAVLLYLLHVRVALENDIRYALSGGRYAVASHVAAAVLRDLEGMGLVWMEKVGRYKVYRLTELGRRVAEELSRIAENFARRMGLA
jgi:DNA-binding MarR family transcriptional regulator